MKHIVRQVETEKETYKANKEMMGSMEVQYYRSREEVLREEETRNEKEEKKKGEQRQVKVLKDRDETKRALFEEYKLRKEIQKREVKARIEELRREARVLGIPIIDSNAPERDGGRERKKVKQDELEVRSTKGEKKEKEGVGKKAAKSRQSQTGDEGKESFQERQSEFSQSRKSHLVSRIGASNASRKSYQTEGEREDGEEEEASPMKSQSSVHNPSLKSHLVKRKAEIESQLSDLQREEAKLDLSISKRSSRKMEYSHDEEFDFEKEKEIMIKANNREIGVKEQSNGYKDDKIDYRVGEVADRDYEEDKRKYMVAGGSDNKISNTNTSNKYDRYNDTMKESRDTTKIEPTKNAKIESNLPNREADMKISGADLDLDKSSKKEPAVKQESKNNTVDKLIDDEGVNKSTGKPIEKKDNISKEKFEFDDDLGAQKKKKDDAFDDWGDSGLGGSSKKNKEELKAKVDPFGSDLIEAKKKPVVTSTATINNPKQPTKITETKKPIVKEDEVEDDFFKDLIKDENKKEIAPGKKKEEEAPKKKEEEVQKKKEEEAPKKKEEEAPKKKQEVEKILNFRIDSNSDEDEY